MIVLEVRLENIKSFGSPAEVIRFSRGINAVSGQNGAGKSTVLEAIGAALFQHLPYRQESFVREGESAGTITIVVESNLDGRSYEVVRKVGRQATQQVFDPDIQQFVARGEADVGRWLRHHLQVDLEVDLKSLFVDSIGPPQGTLTAAFLDAAMVRRAKFNRLLRVDDYENAYKNLVALESAIDADRASVDRHVAELEVETRGRADLERQRFERRDQQIVLASRLSDLTAEQEQVEAILTELGAAEGRLREARAAHSVAAVRAERSEDRLFRAKADHRAAALAADTVERLREARERYLEADTALTRLDAERRTRDGLRVVHNDWTLKRSEAQGKLESIDRSISDGEAARGEIVDLERRIPLQDAAEARDEAARLAQHALDDNRKRFATVQDLTVRAKARLDRAETSQREAEGKRLLAAELSERQLAHQTLTQRLVEIDQAIGTVKTLRERVAAQQRPIQVLRAKLAEIDSEVTRLASSSHSGLPLESIEAKHRQVVEERAAAATVLKFARESRVMVKGGLCPLLHEECRNIRPGITLEGHFDGEIELWNGRLAQFTSAYREVEQELVAARKQTDDLERLERATAERNSVAGDLGAAESRIREEENELRLNVTFANGRASVYGQLQLAAASLEAAREAARTVGLLPRLSHEADEAREDLRRCETELHAVRAAIASSDEVEAEVVGAAAEKARIGRPRDAITHCRAAVDRLPALHREQQKLQSAIGEAAARLAEVNVALEPFANLDHSIQERRLVRDENRAESEQFVAAEPAAKGLPAALTALAEAESSVAKAVEVTRAAAASAEAANVAYNPETHNLARSRRSDIGAALGATRADLNTSAAEEKRLEREIARVARLEIELATERSHLDAIDRERQLAGTMRTAIRLAGPEITKQLLGKISRTASQINAEILNQAGIEVEWTGDYDIVTRRQGESRGFAQLSGGEQMAAALAVRLAATRHLSRIRFAFLDEPTAHLDEARRSNLGSQVLRLQGFDQLVVISHDDTFDGLFGQVIRIVREDGRSRVLSGS